MPAPYYRDQMSRDLTPAEVDANFRHVLNAVADVSSDPTTSVEFTRIDFSSPAPGAGNVVVGGKQMYSGLQGIYSVDQAVNVQSVTLTAEGGSVAYSGPPSGFSGVTLGLTYYTIQIVPVSVTTSVVFVLRK